MCHVLMCDASYINMYNIDVFVAVNSLEPKNGKLAAGYYTSYTTSCKTGFIEKSRRTNSDVDIRMILYNMRVPIRMQFPSTSTDKIILSLHEIIALSSYHILTVLLI